MSARHLMIAALAAAGLALAGCGGGGGSSTPTAQTCAAGQIGTYPDCMDPPTPYETATAAIAAATTAEAAQAAYDAVKDDVTAAQGATLQAAVDARIDALATMDRAAEQRMALTTAAGNVDTSDLMTAADIAAANTAIAALKTAIAAAVDVDDTSMYQGQVDDAEAAVMLAQSALDHDAQTAALEIAVTALQDIDLTDLSTQAKIDAAETAIAAVQTALDAATELSAAEKTMATTELATANRTVMMAQGRFDTAAQMAALEEAVDALEALDLDNLMTQADIDAAVAAITGLNLALEAATNLTDAQKLDATVDVTVAQRKVDRAEETLTANVEGQRKALMDAVTDLEAIDLEDLDTAEKIAAANTAINALKAALVGATHLSDAEKTAAMDQLDDATEDVRMAETGMERGERMTTQREAITNAVTMARTAVGGVRDDSTDTEVASADAAIAALKKAIDDAEDLPEGDADVASAQGTLTTLEGQLASAKRSRETAIAKADEDRGKANAELGEHMRGALTGTDATPATGVRQNGLFALTADGKLTISTPSSGGPGRFEGDAFPDNPPASWEADDSTVASLGGWAGANYANTHATTKVVDEARVYSNQGAPKRVAFAKALPTGVTVATATAGDAVKGYLLIAVGGTVETALDIDKVTGATFTHSGEQTHTYDPDGEVGFKTRGYYDGAPGMYRCVSTDASACSSTNDGKGSPSALGGTWHFKPDANAMVSQPDSEFLAYGWWLNKNKDGEPMLATAFVDVVEPADGDLDNGGDLTALTGSATYVGGAAGLFGMSNPLDGTGSGGHFTADAELSATFSGTTTGVTGTIDNFRLNDGDENPGWSVALNRGALGASGGTITASNTVWSINGNKAPASGSWEGTMYDELPGDAPDGDGSNIPTTVTGTFHSEFSSIGRMVGAFGANKQ